MNWPEAFTMLFACLGVSIVVHGFPKIDMKIGGKHTYINRVEEVEEEETEEE